VKNKKEDPCNIILRGEVIIKDGKEALETVKHVDLVEEEEDQSFFITAINHKI
jgi:hypothetical protein